jgi:hypothetical protein
MQLTPPLKVRERVQHYASLDEPVSFDNGVKGAITGAFNNALMGGDRSMYSAALHRRLVWGFLFTKDDCIPGECHSKALSPTEWNALFRWMGASWDKRHMRPQFQGEVRWIYQWVEKMQKLLKDNPSITMSELITICSNGDNIKENE